MTTEMLIVLFGLPVLVAAFGGFVYWMHKEPRSRGN
jgi:hypothetical protein